ncbi:MAG: hypothetical protein ACYS5V_01385 [Planctomycetota bacterium]|jgi:hypothetical protein
MSQDKDNLAAGRLGTPSSKGGKRSRRRGGRPSNYGVGRLGIISSDQDEPSPVEPPKPEPPKPEPSKPEPPKQKASSVSAEQMARIFDGEPEVTQHPSSTRRSDGSYYELPFGRRRSERDGGRKRALLVAALGAMLAILLIVGFWASRGDDAAPEAARADQAPTVRQVPAPPARPTHPDTRHLAARPRRPDRPRPDRDPGKLWIPPPPAETDPSRPSNAHRIPPEVARRRPAPARDAWPTAPANRPAAPTVVTPTGIEVNCIMRGFGKPAAIINNRLVEVGETIEGAKLVSVGEFAVEVELKGKRFQIGVTSSGAPPSAPQPEEEDAEETSEEGDSDEDDE